MKITWSESMVDGRFYNDRIKALTIQPLYNPAEFEVVHGITSIDVCKTLYSAKVRANEFIRISQCQSELSKVYTKNLRSDNMDNNKEFVEASEVVNADDREYADHNAFLLAIGSYGEHKFTVYSKTLQDALEILGEYCKDKEYNGLLEFNWDNLEGFWLEHWFPVNGGEYYLIMPGYIKEVTL